MNAFLSRAKTAGCLIFPVAALLLIALPGNAADPLPAHVISIDVPEDLPLDLPAAPIALALPRDAVADSFDGGSTVTVPENRPAAWFFSPIPAWQDSSPGISVGNAPVPISVRIASYPVDRAIRSILLRGYSQSTDSARISISLPGYEAGLPFQIQEFTVAPGLLRLPLPDPLPLAADQALEFTFQAPAGSTWLGSPEGPAWCGIEAEILAPEPIEISWNWRVPHLEWSATPAIPLGPEARFALALPLPENQSDATEFLNTLETHSGRFLPVRDLEKGVRRPDWEIPDPGPQIRAIFNPAGTSFIADLSGYTQCWKNASEDGFLFLSVPVESRLELIRPSENLVPPLNIPVLQPADPEFGDILKSVYRLSVFSQVPLQNALPYLAELASIHGWNGSPQADFIRQKTILILEDDAEYDLQTRLSAIGAFCELALWKRDKNGFSKYSDRMDAILRKANPLDSPADMEPWECIRWLNAVRLFQEASRMAGIHPGLSAGALIGARDKFLAEQWNPDTATFRSDPAEGGIRATLLAAANGWLGQDQLASFIELLDARRSQAPQQLPLPLGQELERHYWLELYLEIRARVEADALDSAWDLFQRSVRLLANSPADKPGASIRSPQMPDTPAWDPSGLQGLIPASYITAFFGLRPEADGLMFVPRFPQNLNLTMFSRIHYADWHLACARHFNLAVIRLMETGFQTGGLAAGEQPYLLSPEVLHQNQQELGVESLSNRSIWKELMPAGVRVAPLPMMPPPR